MFWKACVSQDLRLPLIRWRHSTAVLKKWQNPSASLHLPGASESHRAQELKYSERCGIKKIKLQAATGRPMTTPLFPFCCVQLGISIQNLDLLTIGMLFNMYAESSNDEYNGYDRYAEGFQFVLIAKKETAFKLSLLHLVIMCL